jgi:hypothetical protein
MAHPAAFLNAAMSLPAVTNGRASGDYANPVGNLLNYGTAAPFFSAVGMAPSKDNWWSTPNQPKPRSLKGGPPPCDGGNRNVTDNFLHALGKETRLFAPLIYRNDHFTMTGSGQT